MRKLLVLLFLTITFPCACSQNIKVLRAAPENFIYIGDSAEYTEHNGGKLYPAVSENFDIAVYPVEISCDADGLRHIEYAFDVYNKTENTFRGFETTLWADSAMENYIQHGQTAFPLQKMDLLPKSRAENGQGVWGFQASQVSVLASPEETRELGAEREDIQDIAGIMKLRLAWRGGEEYYEFHADVNGGAGF